LAKCFQCAKTDSLRAILGTLIDRRGHINVRERVAGIVDNADLAAGATQIDANVKRRLGLGTRDDLT
jgi:hypothetical protein